jgi:hypothetical protein
MSFEHFCGLVGEDNSQWQPNLLRNTLTIHPMADDTPRFLFSSMPDLHSPDGLKDLSQSAVHDEILVTSREPIGNC